MWGELMSSLADIRTALAQTISNGVKDTLFTYATVEDVEELPAVIVWPAEANMVEAMGRGTDCWWFNVFVLCSKADEIIGQTQLDGYVSGGGPNSIRQVLFERSDLNLPDTDATATRVVGYGGTFQSAKIPLVGAILKVRVYTDGRA